MSMGGKPKRMWDNYQEIAYIPRSTTKRIVVAVGIRGGVKYINLREFYLCKKDGLWKPGREGMAIAVNCPMLIKKPEQEEPELVVVPTVAELQKAMQVALKYLETMPLYDEKKAIYY